MTWLTEWTESRVQLRAYLRNQIRKGGGFVNFGLLLALAACATAPEPKVRTVEAKVPVIQRCVTAEVPGPPASYADDGAKAAPDAADRYRLIAAGLAQRIARLAIVEPVLVACR